MHTLEDPMYWLLCLIFISMAAFLVFGLDKRRAVSGTSRIPEAALLLLALAGGTLGGFAGMAVFNHKVRKTSFIVKMCLIFLIQLIVLNYLLRDVCLADYF